MEADAKLCAACGRAGREFSAKQSRKPKGRCKPCIAAALRENRERQQAFWAAKDCAGCGRAGQQFTAAQACVPGSGGRCTSCVAGAGTGPEVAATTAAAGLGRAAPAAEGGPAAKRARGCGTGTGGSDATAAPPVAAPSSQAAAPPDYARGAKYWAAAAATVDGVLGGFGHLSAVDLRDSHAFLRRLPRFEAEAATADMGDERHRYEEFDVFEAGSLAASCGAGIGREAKGLLLRHCAEVDLVELNPAYTAAARAYVNARADTGGSAPPHPCPPLPAQPAAAWVGGPVLPPPLPADRVREIYTLGLQDWRPAAGAYDLIWIQWVVGHLSDDDLVHRATAGVLVLLYP